MSEELGILLTHEDYLKLSQLVRTNTSKGAAALEEEISRAQVVPQTEIAADIITMNSSVRFLDEETGKESSVTLVYPQDANLTESKISILAPIGVALIGLKVGQSIDWPLPNGSVKAIRVLAVDYQPEAAGEWAL